ncbi:MAG TPA: (Fe-S)-binding protein [Candidatus Humimicrobiaceae bacterium]
MLVESYKIIEILLCLADVRKIRVIAMISNDVSEVLPYINAINKKAIYIKNANAITITEEGKLITIHPRKIALTKLKDEAEAKELLDKTLKLLNETFERKDEIVPDYEKRGRLNVLDLYKLLPKTDCRNCGELTCLAFAASVISESISIMRCANIFKAEYKNSREKILELLQNSGIEIPSNLK